VHKSPWGWLRHSVSELIELARPWRLRKFAQAGRSAQIAPEMRARREEELAEAKVVTINQRLLLAFEGLALPRSPGAACGARPLSPPPPFPLSQQEPHLFPLFVAAGKGRRRFSLSRLLALVVTESPASSSRLSGALLLQDTLDSRASLMSDRHLVSVAWFRLIREQATTRGSMNANSLATLRWQAGPRSLWWAASATKVSAQPEMVSASKQVSELEAD